MQCKVGGSNPAPGRDSHLLLPCSIGPLLVLLSTTHLQSYLHSTPCAATAPSLAAVLLPVMHPVKIALTANDPASLTAGLTASSSYMERQQQLDHGGENGDDDSAVTGRAVIE